MKKNEKIVELEVEEVATANEEMVVEEVVALEKAEVRAERKKKIKGHNQKVGRVISNTIIYIILILMSFIWLFPIAWLVLNSFRGESTGLVNYFIPKEYTFKNYATLFTDKDMPYLRWFLNTLIVAIFTCLFSTIIVLLTSYTFSRLRFKGRQTIMKFLMVLGMFPGFMSMIAIYFILKGMGLLPTESNPTVPLANYLVALILVYSSGAAMGYYISKGFFDTISHAIDEAAEIDGANKAQIFWHIILPFSKPIVIYTALTAFMGPWGDYIFVNTITRGYTQAWSVARGLFEMVNGVGKLPKYFTVFCAGATLISLPITILFIWMQKYYVSGVTGGAVKG
jgi:arabinogalactan oligomer/maltooligosaccharide transport system permease protein